MNLPRLLRIRWAVRAVLALGVAASIAGNVLHADGGMISQIISAWSPLALLLTIELISRVPVHSRSLAFARWAATAIIAGIAAWVSYWHMASVASRYGETGGSQYLLPLSVDGLVVVASVSLLELGGRIAAAIADTATATETATDTTAVVTSPEPPAAPTPAPEVDVKPAVKRPRAKSLTSAQKVTKVAAKMPDATPAQVAAKAGVSESTVRRYLPADKPAADVTVTSPTPVRPAATSALPDAA